MVDHIHRVIKVYLVPGIYEILVPGSSRKSNTGGGIQKGWGHITYQVRVVHYSTSFTVPRTAAVQQHTLTSGYGRPQDAVMAARTGHIWQQKMTLRTYQGIGQNEKQNRG